MWIHPTSFIKDNCLHELCDINNYVILKIFYSLQIMNIHPNVYEEAIELLT